MEEKSLRHNKPKAWDNLNQNQRILRECPFCGNPKIQTRIAEKTGVRWFDCNVCTMALKFELLNSEQSIEAFNTRHGE